MKKYIPLSSSDKEIKMAGCSKTPQDACCNILAAVHSSNLHFLVQESPFSMYITLRKKFTSTSPVSVTQNLSKEAELEKQIVQDSNKIKILEDKLAHAEEELYKASNIFKDQKGNLTDEIKILKVSLKKSQAESSENIKSLRDNIKIVKGKEKEIYTLESKVENLVETNRKLKEAEADIKKDHGKCAKTLKNLEKKTRAEKERLEFKLGSKENDENFNSKVSNPITDTSLALPSSTPFASASALSDQNSPPALQKITPNISQASALLPSCSPRTTTGIPPSTTASAAAVTTENKDEDASFIVGSLFKLECEKLSKLIDER